MSSHPGNCPSLFTRPSLSTQATVPENQEHADIKTSALRVGIQEDTRYQAWQKQSKEEIAPHVAKRLGVEAKPPAKGVALVGREKLAHSGYTL